MHISVPLAAHLFSELFGQHNYCLRRHVVCVCVCMCVSDKLNMENTPTGRSSVRPFTSTTDMEAGESNYYTYYYT